MLTKEQAMVGQEFVSLHTGTMIPSHAYAGHRGRFGAAVSERPRVYKRNGETKTWECAPDRWEVPTKIGSNEWYTITNGSAYFLIGEFMLLEEYEVRVEYGFSAETPAGIVADRCRDDGDDWTADRIMGIS